MSPLVILWRCISDAMGSLDGAVLRFLTRLDQIGSFANGLLWRGRTAFHWIANRFFASRVFISRRDPSFGIMQHFLRIHGPREHRNLVVETILKRPTEQQQESGVYLDYSLVKAEHTFHPAYSEPVSILYNGRLFYIQISHNVIGPNRALEKDETMSISIWGRNSEPIRKLLEDAAEAQNAQKKEDFTRVYKPFPLSGQIEWGIANQRRCRDIDTIIIDERIKRDVLSRVGGFLKPDTEQWYSNLGIPYRLGILFSGHPGTGKTSLALGIASQFRLDVYTLNLGSINMNDDEMSDLLSDVPSRSILLLEDLHAVEVLGQASTKRQGPASTKSSLSLPGLLNAIDGVSGIDGCVVIMTTNDITVLNEALIRPGRVDKVVDFQYATGAQASALFLRIFAKGEPSEELKRMAAHFGKSIPEGEFTAAEIQGHLLDHQTILEDAVAETSEWVSKLRDKKSSETPKIRAGGN